MDWYDGPPLLRYLEAGRRRRRPPRARPRAAAGAVRRPPARRRPPRLPRLRGPRRRRDAARRRRRRRPARAARARGSPASTRSTARSTRPAPPMSVDRPPGRRPRRRRAAQVIASPTTPPAVVRELVADVAGSTSRPLRAGGRYLLKARDADAPARRSPTSSTRSTSTRSGATRAATALELNDIGRVRLRTAEPLVADPYAENRATGAFILIDEHTNATVAAGHGRRRGRVEPAPAAQPERRAPRRRRSRARSAGRRSARSGATVWLTGLPSSGKSTIAAALEALLVGRGRAAYVLDGDNAAPRPDRRSRVLAERRAESVRRAGEAARARRRRRRCRLVSLVSPVSRRPRRRAPPPPGRGAAVPRDPRGHAGRGVRAPRSQGPVREGPRGRDQGLHRDRRPLRGAGRPGAAHRRHRAAGGCRRRRSSGRWTSTTSCDRIPGLRDAAQRQHAAVRGAEGRPAVAGQSRGVLRGATCHRHPARAARLPRRHRRPVRRRAARGRPPRRLRRRTPRWTA